jgi:hypothetical protein
MILIHRITPFFIGSAAAAGFLLMVRFGLDPRLGIPLTLLVVGVLFARLCQWQARSFQFWYLVGTPLVFLLSALGFLLFLESPSQRLVLSAVAGVGTLLFAELTFHYLHAPARYQPYSIEHLSLALNVVSMFFLGTVAFGMRMLLQLPLWQLAGAFAAVSLFVFYGTLWVSKVTGRAAFAYAAAGAVLATELFSVVTFLPTGFYTDAAMIALYLYVFLGLTRAHFLDKLSPTVTRRYLGVGAALLTAIVGTARWV